MVVGCEEKELSVVGVVVVVVVVCMCGHAGTLAIPARKHIDRMHINIHTYIHTYAHAQHTVHTYTVMSGVTYADTYTITYA